MKLRTVFARSQFEYANNKGYKLTSYESGKPIKPQQRFIISSRSTLIFILDQADNWLPIPRPRFEEAAPIRESYRQ
jgi:hypothetical protein